MMSIKSWYLIHKWTSLVCTLSLLMLCVTGLPLIFHEEIEHYLMDEVEAPEMSPELPATSMDRIAEAARLQRPDNVIRYMFWDADHHPNLTLVSMASSMEAPPDENNFVVVDSRTAKVLDEPAADEGFMYIMFKLHVDMFAGLPGMLFLGFMGLLFVVAIVSGVVLYAPFMRKLDFGTVRKDRSSRLKWLDLHNLLGVVTLVWALVVGITGSINTLSQVLLGVWQQDQLAEMVAPYKDLPPATELGSLETAMETARKAVSDMEVNFVAYPGTMFSSLHHYAVFMNGKTPVTSRLLQPALVDAQTGALTDSRSMPWYIQGLLLSQPLHFGDYGGLPLKIIWAILDIITIVVLVSGLYLWWGRRKSPVRQHIAEVETGGGMQEIAR